MESYWNNNFIGGHRIGIKCTSVNEYWQLPNELDHANKKFIKDSHDYYLCFDSAFSFGTNQCAYYTFQDDDSTYAYGVRNK